MAAKHSPAAVAAPEPLDSQYGFRSLYVGPASRGWEGVLEDDVPAPPSPEAAARFLAEVVEHRLDVVVGINSGDRNALDVGDGAQDL